MGRTYEVSAPRVVDTNAATALSRLSPIARAYCRLADKQVLFAIGDRLRASGRDRTAADA
jgi:hypothetical protein